VAEGVFELDVVGTLGVLVLARRRVLIGPLAPVIGRLVASGIHLSDVSSPRVAWTTAWGSSRPSRTAGTS
jgi:predicted nucleic acid-binding protein